MKYLLDTNAVIALTRRKPVFVARISRVNVREIGVSAIVMHELYFGAYKSEFVDRNLANYDRLEFEVLDFTPEDAEVAGRIRSGLERIGRPIGAYDVLIAGQALARRLTLVTNNVAEFVRVPDLVIEDWQAG